MEYEKKNYKKEVIYVKGRNLAISLTHTVSEDTLFYIEILRVLWSGQFQALL